MSPTGMQGDAVVICANCGCQQTLAIGDNRRIRACQDCNFDLRFEREVACPHCRKGVQWNADLSACPHCKGAFAPGIPLRPKPLRSLTRALTSALDAAKAREWEYLETDVMRRSERLYWAWAVLSRNEGSAGAGAEPEPVVRPVRVKTIRRGSSVKPWYRRWGVLAGFVAVLIMAVWGGVAAWHAATKEAIQERLSELSKASVRADGAAVGSFYGRTLVRFQNGYDVPHAKAARALGQLFRDYPFVMRFGYRNPVFETIAPGEVSVLVDREWEMRGNDIYSGSERHRLIWRREDGEWRIASQELLKTNWSRRTTPRAEAAGADTAIGVRQ